MWIASIYSKMRVYNGESLKDTDPKAKSYQEYKDFAGVDEGMNLLAVDWGDEGLVHRLVHLVGNPVGRTLGVVHIVRIFFAQVRFVVMGDHLFERMGGFHDELGMLVEHFKKVAFARQELAKQHRGLQGDRDDRGMGGRNARVSQWRELNEARAAKLHRRLQGALNPHET